MRVKIFKNIISEKNPSMQIYAQELLKYMPSNVEGFSIDVCGPYFIHYYFTKEIVYPKIAARNQGDINHIIDHSYCGLLKAMDPKRTIVTCHDLIPLLYPETVSRIGKMRYQLNIKFLSRAEKIITGSWFTKQAIIEKFGKSLEKKIKIIFYGVEDIFKPSIHKDALRRKYNISDTSILHVGNSYRHKNVELILKFLEKHSEFQFVKIGPFRKDHIRYIKTNNLQKQILHFPYIDLTQPDKIADIYNSVGALVLPSFCEGFGLPILEAMACGCPVVCSNIPSFIEIAQKSAVFFNPNNFEEFESMLYQVFNDTGLKADIIKNGLSLAAKYSWKECAEQTYKIYREVYEQI